MAKKRGDGRPKPTEVLPAGLTISELATLKLVWTIPSMKLNRMFVSNPSVVNRLMPTVRKLRDGNVDIDRLCLVLTGKRTWERHR